MADTYTVKKGDTLSEIAKKYLGSASKYKYLAKINGIKSPYRIYVGQVLKLKQTSSSSSSKKNTNKNTKNSNRVTIKHFGLQSNTDRTIFVTWKWGKKHTDKYKVKWKYATGDGVAFLGSESEVDVKQSTYNAPENATKVYVYIKPIAKKHKVNKKEKAYWTAEWSKVKTYTFSTDAPPSTPDVPTVTLEKYKLTAKLANIDSKATKIKFQVVKDDKKVFKTGYADIKTKAASYSCNVVAGGQYKVRCQAIRGKLNSDWSEYSSNVGTMPSAPGGITKLEALSETSVNIEWKATSNTDSYKVEYTTKKEYFDSSSSVQSTTVESVVHNAIITGLESGQEYFFRVRAVNSDGESSWSEIKSITMGKDPAAPTTWSSASTVIVGDPLILYWVHNSEDGSSQTYADLELYIDGVKETHTIKNTEDEEEKDKTSSYTIDTSQFIEGTTIQWRVRTAGITLAYGEWSVQRTVDVYAPPTLELNVTNQNEESIDTLESFPFYIYGLPGPKTQTPIGYHLSIVSNEVYETVDQVGNEQTINEGETVYSKYFDINEELLVEFTPGNIDLESNISYKVICTVSMDSGLTAESTYDFTVAWTDESYVPNAEIGIDEDTLTASIRPYCEEYPDVYYKVVYNAETEEYTATTEQIDELEGMSIDGAFIEENDEMYEVYQGTNATGEEVLFCMKDSEEGVLVEGITLSVYRREFDGSFVELGTGLNNLDNTFVTDPHPALDYARYRIVAITNDTGAVSYYDVPGYPVEEKAVVIQWDEDWTNFRNESEDALAEPPWAGSLLKLPYNIDVADKYDPDVSLVNYIGRKRPVSYYGTHLGETSTWNVDIVKSDEETLYALRRLSIWTGDVYVREPSGSGYWANINVSFSQKHKELTIPVTLSITRVEGGV